MMNKKIKRTSLLFFFLMATYCVVAQTEAEKAYQLGKEAVKVMDSGDPNKAIDMLKEAQQLDPGNIDYPYEIAYACIMLKDYKKAIAELEKIVDHKDVNDRVYATLGNCYDYEGKPEKAAEIYDAGLIKFPHSGQLYLEKGNLYLMKEKYNDALELYEKGIQAEPSFRSNYYWAAKIFFSSNEKVWGMIYGEIFMNLERNTKRTAEMSKLLYDTYKSQITFKSKNEVSVKFCENTTIVVSDPEKIKMPFSSIYEITTLLACTNEKKINAESLNSIRTGFIEAYFQKDNATEYPNALFDYEKKVKDAGHLEAYNHWIIMKGDEEAFESWSKKNKDKWDNFIEWFSANPLKLTLDNYFYRAQY